MKRLKRLSDTVGKTVKKTQWLNCDEEAVITFNDHSYLVLTPSVTRGESVINMNDELEDWKELRLGIITQDEHDDRKRKAKIKQEVKTEQREKKQLVELIKKHGLPYDL